MVKTYPPQSDGVSHQLTVVRSWSVGVCPSVCTDGCLGGKSVHRFASVESRAKRES